MKEFLKRLVFRTTLSGTPKSDQGHVSDYRVAKAFWELKLNAVRAVKDTWLVVLGIFSAAFGFKGFLLTNGFIDGGATGVSDRKSTRLNSSHSQISYAVFCLKKKKKTSLTISGITVLF